MSSKMRTVNPDSPHLSDDQMRLYRNRALAVEDLCSADRHLSGCVRCRRVLLARMDPIRLPEEARQMPEPLHLSYEQIAGYLDGALTAAEKRLAEAHFFLCASCSRELEGLKRLDTQLAVVPAAIAAPAAAAAAKAPAAVPLSRKIAEFFRFPGRIRDFGLAFGAMAAGLLVTIHASYIASPAGNQSRDAARLVMPGTQSHPGLGAGGILLLAFGAGYLLYSLRRKK